VQRGCTVALLTTPELILTDEFSTHLADVANDVRLVPSLNSYRWFSWQLLRTIRSELRLDHGCVVPESDRHLLAVLAGRLLAGRHGQVASVVMRPPFRDDELMTRVIGGVKATTMVLARAARPLGLELLLLDDALPSPRPVWSQRLRWTGSVLRDPPDLFLHDEPTRPQELDDLGDSPVISVLGSLDARKHVSQILDLWSEVSARTGASLVLAGRIRTDVVPSPAPHVCFVDRYLSDRELAWVLRRSTAVIVMYDGGASSGIVSACAAAGIRVIAPYRSRLYHVASAHSFGIPMELSAAGLAIAIAEACLLPRPAPIESLPNRDDFGAVVLDAVSPRR
jgi:hypothetical protein